MPVSFDPAPLSLTRDLLRSLDTTPNRLLGQNFLVNAGALDHVVQTAAIEAGDAVLEVGPGLGALTVRLMPRAARFAAVEKDARLAAFLREKLAPLHLLSADALDVSWDALDLPAAGVKLVSNLPFSISKPMLRRIFEEWRPHLHSATVLLQREVANRLLAAPATPEYGPLSLMAALYGRTRRAFDVSPGSFFPPPEVTCSVVRIELLETPALVLRDERRFWLTVRAAFGQRRKTLSNTLKPLAPRDELHAAFTRCDINPQRRGETLSLQEFAALSDALIPAP